MQNKIRKSFRSIRRVYKKLSVKKQNIEGGSAGEWLLDNFYIIKQEYATLHTQHFPSRTAKKNADRMLALAKAYFASHAYRLEGWTLSEMLSTEQSTVPFSADSLRFLPYALRAALLIHIEELCPKLQDSTLMGNCIRSFIALRELDIRKLFEAHCVIDKILAADPAYRDMTFSTKDIYRRAISRLAAHHSVHEEDIAKAAIKLTVGKKGKAAHVGFYLIGEGQTLLRKTLSLPPMRFVHRSATYFCAVFLLTACLFGIVSIACGSLFWALLSLLPLTDISIQLLQYILLKATPVRRLPALRLENGLPEPVLVVYPSLLSSVEKAEEMAQKLEICYLANRDDALRFAVLGDFKDSDTHTEDAAIPNACAAVIRKLNRKYGDRFFLLHREQTYSEKQSKWMGAERKRGALEALNLFLRGKYTFRYTEGDTSLLQKIRYVITLDDDTLLPPGAALSLAGIAMHPFNAPTVKNGIVTDGYGIIQPRVSIRLESACRTLFSRIFAGEGGIDTYHAAVSEFYMDLFGESVFTGKGMYHVDTFLACISFPPDTVLSHDLLEGSYVRCGLASDVQVFDGFPAAHLPFIRRQHRWIRGDWQILPWLLRYVKNADGVRVQNPLSSLSRWKIFDNLRRSIMPVLQLVLLLFGNMSVVLVALFSLLFPVILYITDALLQKSFLPMGEKTGEAGVYGFRSALYRMTLSVAFLAHTAAVSIDAIWNGIRRTITHKRSLEWVTAADAERMSFSTLSGYYQSMSSSVLIGLVLCLAALAGLQAANGLRLILAVIWLFAPAIAWITGKEQVQDPVTLSPATRTKLLDTASHIWNYFRDYMTEEEHYLPPDNLQLRPYKGIAHRTSPTNIGLGILACLSACDLGFITASEMLTRIENTMDTIESLEKWKGHLYNWYDTRTCKPMAPRYISTVDSGNLACYLVTAAMGVKEYAGENAALAARLLRFVDSMDFLPLYHTQKRLFSIGFSVDENRLTDSYYDLLISEARQTGFLAIALGKIPPEHWFALSRGLTAADGYKGLVSWSGTMFEYYMPLLIMKSYKNTLLHDTYRFALRTQRLYGRRLHVPWGVSESGFYAFDLENNYQYKAFGVPELGLCRRLNEDIVITPYATMLALLVDPRAAIANLSHLQKEGLCGEYGFFEAADYTPARFSGNMRRGIVKSYMAHHQGMSLVALCNVLCDNAMQRRFHAHPAVRATEPLLKERVPVRAPVIRDRRPHIAPVRFRLQASAPCRRQFTRTDSVPNPVQLLTNGSYHLLLDSRGQGRSMRGSVHFNRFSAIHGGGQNIWIVNTNNRKILDGYGTSCTFSDHHAVYTGNNQTVATHLSICVCPEDDCEIRRLTVSNKSPKRRTFEIYYYTEPSLCIEKAESAHPAFSKLFITTQAENGALYAVRRKRQKDEKTFVGFTAALTESIPEGGIQFDTDRLSFWGRGNSAYPQTLLCGSIPAGKTGTVLDPCFAFRLRISVEGGESSSVTFLAGLAESVEKARSIIEKYRHDKRDHTAEAAQFIRKNEAASFRPGEEEAAMHAAGYMVYGHAPIRDLEDARKKNVLPLRALWKFGISGDKPIFTQKISRLSEKSILDAAVCAHAYWKRRGLDTDLVILCDESGGYTRPIFDMAKQRAGADVYILCMSEMDKKDIALLIAASRLYTAQGGLASLPPYPVLAKEPEKAHASGGDQPLPSCTLLFDNGYGGFDAETGEYVITQSRGRETPLPWVHVLANDRFGFIAGESGSGFTFSGNSQRFRLSPWFNDICKDPLGEILTVSDAADIWSPMAGVFPEEGIFRTRFGFGYVSYRRITRSIHHEVLLFTPPDAEKKVILLSLTNLSVDARRIEVQYRLTPVLGTLPSPDDVTIRVEETGVWLQNLLSDTKKSVYLTVQGGGKYGKSGDDVYASRSLLLPPQKKETLVFILGTDDTPAIDAPAAFCRTRKYWNDLLSVLQVKTADKATDLLINGWLLYQTLACRIFARSAFYQSGGAFGFRDQLQDVLAFCNIAPNLVKKQILLHAAHQFSEGDVFHWWHTDETGVRTRFSDDRLWLPYVACIYAETTGDDSIWDEMTTFVTEPVLETQEEERYTYVKGRTEPFSLYEHAVRAIDISRETGMHCLPLMGGGDWNDGMNAVGIKGKGESVWLGWFLKSVLEKMASVSEKRGDTDRARAYRRDALILAEAAETEAWDGTHYARAFFDNGAPLGTSACAECAIDAISQSWAVIAGGTSRTRMQTAMDSVYHILTDREKGIICLLTPPFQDSKNNPGYIQSYPAGIRENGGQYTHGAVWAAIAFAMLGDQKRAFALFRMLNPILHAETHAQANVYKTEPYVMAADVYTAPGHAGRGGWSWYTGAASWMYQLAVHYLLGFRKEGETVSFVPCLPEEMQSFTLRYTYRSTLHIFHVHGKGGPFPLFTDGKTHEFEV